MLRATLALPFLALGAIRSQTIAVDSHQHLMGPTIAALAGRPAVTAERLILSLDSAHIHRALVLSIAYQFGNPNRPAVENEYEKVRAENDWTADQVSHFPDRLRAFCAVNPLREYAVTEIDRCASIPALRSGLKLHFGNSDIQLDQPEQMAQMKRVFAAANAQRMAIVMHMHANVNLKRPYGATQARMLLDSLLPIAKDIPVQIAHFAGAGGYEDPTTDEALGVFVDAVKRKDPRLDRVWFDISGVVRPNIPGDRKELVAQRIRELGTNRIVFGTDVFAGMTDLATMVTAFHTLPLTDAEFHAIESNVPPYLRW